MRIDTLLQPNQLKSKIERLFDLSGKKIVAIEAAWDESKGTPVFTIRGQYASRGWTEWTQGFQYGSALLQYDATDDSRFLEIGVSNTLKRMAPHITHIGVHDHGFNNISTYGNILRLMSEDRIPDNEWQREFCKLAIRCSGAVQAARWTVTANGLGYIYSFNGPHSLFVDTIRSLRVLGLSHKFGHTLMGENDKRISLLERLLHHALNTARFNVFHGEGRDAYDIRGRTAHEAIFNLNDGNFRCPSTQQGYSPFSTWTRGLAWALLGFAEELEFLQTLDSTELEPLGGKEQLMDEFVETAMGTADFYIENTPTDGIPYWDTGAPGLANMGDYLNAPSDPFNPYEPVDSSAAAIAAQGFLRLGKFLIARGESDRGNEYYQAGLTVAASLMEEPYLSTDEAHHGLILHSVYHRPNGWDHAPNGGKVPYGESTMWGDYHARELGALILREAEGLLYPTFFGC